MAEDTKPTNETPEKPQAQAGSGASSVVKGKGKKAVKKSTGKRTGKKRKSATKKPGVAKKKTGNRYTAKERQLLKDKVLEVMARGRSFNGAVALIRRWAKGLEPVPEWGKWKGKNIPDRATLYRWLDDKEFQEDTEATGEDNYGFYEEVAKKVAKGGAVVTEDIHYYKGEIEGECGPVKRITRSFTPPNPQATLKGMARQEGHLRKIARTQGDARKEALIEVPSSIPVMEDEDGNDIPKKVSTIRIVIDSDGKSQEAGEVEVEHG